MRSFQEENYFKTRDYTTNRARFTSLIRFDIGRGAL